MIVFTLTKVPNSLRGDLTKWCQEIQTGVYVGNFSARIRDLLWQRILENIGNGEATVVYTTNNELGYTFKTTRKDRKVVDFDGIPLMMQLANSPIPNRHGFSKAAKLHRMRKFAGFKREKVKSKNLVAIDIETTGLNIEIDNILSIGAVKRTQKGNLEEFYSLIKTKHKIPENVQKMTGLSNSLLLDKGEDLSLVLEKLKDFVGNSIITGYNVSFDINFLLKAFRSTNQDSLPNKILDLLPIVKRKNSFLSNYHLETVLQAFKIENKEPHQALSDARATLLLAEKII